MRYTEGRIPSQYAAMVFVCTLALVIYLSAVCDAGLCDEVKSPQQSTSAQHKPEISESETAKAENTELKPVEQAKSEKIGVKSEQVAAIDMEILTNRLKKTKAIGLFTKLAIRNDVSDLMNDVKRYRKKSMLDSKIEEIRESFEGLLMKIIALLDDDPELSRDMYVGRELIWKSLLEVKV
jgi:hypothetical protein